MSIYLVTGNKGGVGKSFAATALIDLLLASDKTVTLFDADPANTDVLKAHVNEIKCHPRDLSIANGWIDLVNNIADSKSTDFVINTPAGFNASFTAFGATLLNALPELKQTFRPVWVINRQRDSLEALTAFLPQTANHPVTVVRNLHYGSGAQFELYGDSKIKKAIEATNGITIDLPDLSDRVTDQLIKDRLSIAAAIAAMPLGNRMELQRWRNDAHANFAKLIA